MVFADPKPGIVRGQLSSQERREVVAAIVRFLMVSIQMAVEVHEMLPDLNDSWKVLICRIPNSKVAPHSSSKDCQRFDISKTDFNSYSLEHWQETASFA